MTVQEARLRAATPDESLYARGGKIWRYSMAPFHFFNKVAGVGQLLWYRTDFLNVQTPHALRATHAIGQSLGLTPERAFIRDLPCFGCSYHTVIKEAKVMEAVLSHHRNDDLFVFGGGGQAFLRVLQQTLPEEPVKGDDFILSCSKLNSEAFRKLISDRMVSVEYSPIIDAEVRKLLDGFARSENPINITQEARLLASSIILKLIFGQNIQSEELTKSVHFISRYIINSLLGLTKPSDETKFYEAAKVLKKTIEAMIADKEFPEFAGITSIQKKAFIFAVFFAGQESTATLLTYIVYALGINQEEQKQLRADLSLQKITDLFQRSIKAFPPFFQISRLLRMDACLEFKCEGDDTLHKVVFPAGDCISVEIYEASKQSGNAKFFPFGHGAHECPGQFLAKREIKTFVKELVERFEFMVVNRDQLKINPSVVLEFDQDVFIQVKPVERLLEPIV